ncbi:uncharacterized protein TM35_000112280 [Trypanosoma theileri]|uniref:Uncharacterized protein n=1 Tax=Trypanosoma theileri TaxID=67003 RepID=A0A1X0NYD6_9TRYP|nr:uncharacterized protein TM35_000112280 [Trypanosoma theileri]ORC89694.1 hypothetical protein TM35_000112280 [Trypanosoma theileri]
MSDAEQRKLLVPRREARNNDPHHYQKSNVNEQSGRRTDFSNASAIGDITESDDETEVESTWCCSGMVAGLRLLCGGFIRPLMTHLRMQRGDEVNHVSDKNNSSERVDTRTVIDAESGKESTLATGSTSFVDPSLLVVTRGEREEVAVHPPSRIKYNKSLPYTIDCEKKSSVLSFEDTSYFLIGGQKAPHGSLNSPLTNGASPINHPIHVTALTTADVVRAIQSERSPLRSVDQLVALLERCAEYLPVRVEVEIEEEEIQTHIQTQDSSVAVCVSVLGPLRPAPHAAVLAVLEDVLLEDCDPTALRIAALHVADIPFAGDAVPTAPRAESNGHLDVLPPLRHSNTDEPHAAARVAAFAKNLLNGGAHINAVRLTRCSFTPSDLGRGLRLPVMHLRQLIFEKCPLTAAHVDALVRLARAENKRSSGGRAHQCLVELQVSGSLTEESVNALLSYFHDDLMDTLVSLRVLRLPSLWLPVARKHPLLEQRPFILVTST